VLSWSRRRPWASGAEAGLPPEVECSERIAAVVHALYLIFSEGYTASFGTALHGVELTAEAWRLDRW
jgi:predicted RNA polymerase sigma factor